MYKLLNMADFCSNEELEKDMQYLSQKYGFDGFELIKFFDGDNSPLCMMNLKMTNILNLFVEDIAKKN